MASEHFDKLAVEYEARRRRLVPSFDDIYHTAVAALELAGVEPRRVLDLGAGTGLMARHVLAAYPDAELTLLDGAPAMLEQARVALGDGASYVEADLADPLPAGPWDAVVSALAIHHLEDSGKRDLFQRIHHALAPGGVFVNLEQVTGPTPLFADAYRRWHERRACELGASDHEWHEAVTAMELTASRRSRTSSRGYAKPASPTSTVSTRTASRRSLWPAAPVQAPQDHSDECTALMPRMACAPMRSWVQPSVTRGRRGSLPS